jgi:hypothetical protein
MKARQLFFLLILLYPIGYLDAENIQWSKLKTTETPVYKLKSGSRQAILNMGYASQEITNKEAWNNKNNQKKVYEVDLVFTAYPKKKEDWITSYQYLLNNRISELIKMEPTLGSDTSVRWNLVLQTQCENEEEAKKLFHGAVFRFRYKTGQKNPEEISLRKFDQASKTNDYAEIQNEVEGIVYGLSDFEDSTVFNALDRNDWGRMLVVTDWTGSMYGFGAQVALWHRLHFDEHKVKTFIFFNDGNRKPDKVKRAGNTGGVYYCNPDNFDYMLKTMGVVMKMGSGGDTPENNLEAVLKGLRFAKDFDEIVMVADNNAGVRDMSLLPKIKKPIRIVLCGVSCGTPIHPHYLEIARKTGGSIHTIEQDIESLTALREGQMMDINGIMYKVKKGKLMRMQRG